MTGTSALDVGAGPVRLKAYHDYPRHPWKSPLYVRLEIGPAWLTRRLDTDSALRPFSGGRP
jgi:hypothetical protein